MGAKIVLGWKGDSFYTRWTNVRVFKRIYIYIYFIKNRNTFFMCKSVDKKVVFKVVLIFTFFSRNLHI